MSLSIVTKTQPRSGEAQHVAIIMDGNGRWANRKNSERITGHRAGAHVVRDIVTHARERGIRYLTLFAFSSENWSRPEDEVQKLMELLEEYLQDEKDTMLQNGIRLRCIGAEERLPQDVQALLELVRHETQNEEGMDLILALSYGARDEIVRAVKKLQASGEEVSEASLSQALDTHGIPDPDLVIRTSGEQRLSNFLLWQAAYSEFYFTGVPWPEFTTGEFDHALDEYKKRKRRFGLTDAQLDAQLKSKA